MATTSASVLELITLRTTAPRDEVLAQQDAVISSVLTKTKGLKSLHWGFEIEEPSMLHWLIGNAHPLPLFKLVLTVRPEWDSMASHEALQSSPGYGPFVAQVQKFAEPSLVHSHITVPKAPVVEWCTVTLAADTNPKTWEAGFEALKSGLEGAEGYYGISAGWTVELQRTYQVLIGWESKEAHVSWKEKLTPKEAAEAMAMFRNGVEKVTMWHVQIGGEYKGEA
jgi:heme-degrading monooxygenase HmoA